MRRVSHIASRGPHFAACLLSALALLLGTAPSAARPKTVKNRQLRTTTGNKTALLAGGRLDVLVFLRPGQEFSKHALPQIEKLRREFSKKRVRFVGLISPRHAGKVLTGKVLTGKVLTGKVLTGKVLTGKKVPAGASSKAGVSKMPLLLDAKDKLAGELAIKMQPTVVLVDRKRRLVGWQVFRKVNFINFIKARIRHVLGEITAAERDAVLHPKKRRVGGVSEKAAAGRYYRLAQILFSAKALAPALKAVTKSLRVDASRAPTQLLAGQILQALKRCKKATAAFRKALSLAPKLSAAKAGLEACK